jgi:hypothetical protein
MQVQAGLQRWPSSQCSMLAQYTNKQSSQPIFGMSMCSASNFSKIAQGWSARRLAGSSRLLFQNVVSQLQPLQPLIHRLKNCRELARMLSELLPHKHGAADGIGVCLPGSTTCMQAAAAALPGQAAGENHDSSWPQFVGLRNAQDQEILKQATIREVRWPCIWPRLLLKSLWSQQLNGA